MNCRSGAREDRRRLCQLICASTPLYTFEDAARDINRFLDGDLGPFDRVFLHIALEPGRVLASPPTARATRNSSLPPSICPSASPRFPRSKGSGDRTRTSRSVRPPALPLSWDAGGSARRKVRHSYGCSQAAG